MKDILKGLYNQITLKGMPIGSKIVVYWFCISLILLMSVGDGTPFPLLMGIIVNFAASVLAMQRFVSPNDYGEDE